MLNGQTTSGTQLPAKNSDTNQENLPRGNGYGEAVIQTATVDGMDMFLSEGSYFAGVLAAYAPGTGVTAAPATQTTFSDTVAMMAIANTAAPGSNKVIRLDTLKLIASAASAANTNFRIVAVTDNISRLSAAPGGTGLVFNPAGGLAGTPRSQVAGYFGNLTIGAATAAKRIVGQTMLKAAVISVNDELILKFTGAPPQSAAGGLANTAVGRYVSHLEPLAILPQQVLLLHAFGTAMTTAPSFEPLLTTIER